ncbi:MAG: hypothetical protein R3D33_06375 [Hyphomicrobiaceae bacterium]
MAATSRRGVAVGLLWVMLGGLSGCAGQPNFERMEYALSRYFKHRVDFADIGQTSQEQIRGTVITTIPVSIGGKVRVVHVIDGGSRGVLVFKTHEKAVAFAESSWDYWPSRGEGHDNGETD